ncbi:MAG: peptide/nickel transport system permease protein [Chthoniobacter sp.]|jgi:peptide/nickel transport system permease protein|nr:peptide/nickel transport system permease protein [Chthoniobacter sp.]
MFSYLVRRLLYAVPILLGVICISFLLDNVMMSPDAKASRVLGPKATGQNRREWIHNRGLDQPKPMQFVHYVGKLATLQFGTSWVTGRDLGEVFLKGVGPSLCITIPGFFAAFFASVGLALFQVFVRNSPLDRTLTFLSVALMSVPTMVYVIFTQAFLALGLSYFPAFGFNDDGFGMARFIMLPVIIFMLINLGHDARLYRAIFLEEMGQDYIRTAQAKGVANARVLGVHVFKNGLIAIITLVVAELPRLVLGSLLIESLFGIPGLGNVLVQAIQTGDQPVIMASVFLGSGLYLFAFILTDIFYALADPRIRLS